MGKTRVYVPIFHSWREAFMQMPPEDGITLLVALIDYSEYGIIPSLKKDLQATFAIIKPSIDASIAKYESRSEQGKRAAIERWHGASTNDADTCDSIPNMHEHAGAYNSMQEHASACVGTFGNADYAKEKETVKEKVTEKGKTNYTAHAQVSSDQSAGVDSESIALPMWGGRDWIMSDDMREELRTQYPAIDIDNALRDMQRWLKDNPQVRYRADNMHKFVRDWLERIKNTPTGNRPQKKNAWSSIESHEYDFDAIENMLLNQNSNDEVVGNDVYSE